MNENNENNENNEATRPEDRVAIIDGNVVIVGGALPLSSKEAAETAEPTIDPKEPPPKFPTTTAIILFILCAASFTTGVLYWYNSHYLPVKGTTSKLVSVVDEQPEQPEPTTPTAPTEEIEPPQGTDTGLHEEIPKQPEPPPRPYVEPMPEFAVLWAEYENEHIVARLAIAGEDFLTVQGAAAPQDWLTLADEVDLLLGLEHNMVVYAAAESAAQGILREYLDYDFFLKHPDLLFSTMYGDFDWEIFSFYVAPSDFPFAVAEHPSEDEWGDILEQFTIVSLYNTMLDVTQNDQIITIAAPTEVSPDLWYVLQARLLRQITS